MTRGQRIAIGFFGTIGFLLVVLVGGVMVLTQTDWGRERVRSFAIAQLQNAVEGEISIGQMRGNLLRRIVLVDVSIVDAQERPFVRADTLSTRYSLLSLLRQRVLLRDTRVVNGRLVLDQPPGEDWNWVRIFRIEPDPEVIEPEPLGWGDWIELRDLTLVDTEITVRAQWSAPEDLTPAEREEALRTALSEDSRPNVVPAEGGYQNVMQFREIYAELPRVLAAHPDTMAIPIDVARFRGILEPFRPPAAVVQDLAGSFRIGADTVFFRDVRASLPGSRMSLEGAYDLESGDLVLHLAGSPVAFADLRWLNPRLPEEGGGSLRVSLNQRALATRVIAREMDLRHGAGAIAGRIDLTVGDTLRIQDTDLRFQRVDTRLIQRLAPAAEFPVHGEMTGEVVLAGHAGALEVDGNLVFAQYEGGTSRIRAEGEVGFAEEVRFGDFRAEFDPLQATLVRAFAPDLPLRGTIEGFAQLTGAAAGPLRLDSDLTLRDPAMGPSRVLATGGVDTRDELRLRNLLVRLDPLRLDLFRDQFPELPTGGVLAGRILLDGVPAVALAIDGDLALSEPTSGSSRVTARGGIAFDDLRFQRLQLGLQPLRLDLLRTHVPELPSGAVLTGGVLLDGAPDRLLDLNANLTLSDPATGVSRLAAQGGVALSDELAFREMRLIAEPVQLDLLRPWVEDLPQGAALEGRAWLDGAPERRLQLDADFTVRDPESGRSRMVAIGGVRATEDPLLHDLNVRLDPLQVNLVRPWLPDLPPDGTLAGAVWLDGSPTGVLRLDGELTHTDPHLGLSRAAARGGLDLGDELAFRSLDLRFDPLRLELVRAFAPELPVGGLLRGTTRLDGAPAARLSFAADLEHREAGEHSVIRGDGEVATGPAGWAAVDLELRPLSLVTAGRFAPEAGLRGSVSGNLQARGEMADLAVVADLRFADGGELSTRGRFDLAGEEPAYDVELATQHLDLAAITARAPAATLLSGTASARGRGTDPATANATIAADLTDSAVDDLSADQVRLRVALADGLARVDESRIRIGTAEASADGSFGLVAGRSGELRYEVSIDSLHAFAPWIPIADTAVAVSGAALEPGPERTPEPAAPELESAVERTAGLTRVRYPGAERPPAPRLLQTDPAHQDEVQLEDPEVPPDRAGPPEIPPDSLAGSLYASGLVRGNVERFDLQGTLRAEDLVVAGNAVGRGRAEYRLNDFGTPEPDLRFDADAAEIRAAGMAFDSATARVLYRGERHGAGTATVALFQDPETDLRLDSDFSLSLQRNELLIGQLNLRFDTVDWRNTRPALVSWGDESMRVDGLELTSNAGGRLFLHGSLPVEGIGDMEVQVDDLEIGHVVTLLQDEAEATGRFSLNAHIAGTLEAPTLEGNLALLEPTLDGRPLPDTHATFEYRDQQLTTSAQLLQEARVLAVAEARLPIDLALTGVEQRLLDRPLEVDLRADSLALDALPAFTDAVEELRGRVIGNVAVRGTFSDPALDGVVDLDLASFHLVPLGIRFEDIAGTLRLQGDVMALDSLVAWSDGPIRTRGTIALPELTQPIFDLEIDARDAWVIDTDDARLRVDADLEVSGPLDGLTLTGEVRTRSGVIYIPELAEFGAGDVVDLEDAGTFARMDTLFVAERALLARESPLLDNLEMDIGVQIDRDVWIRSIEANVEIYTPVEVGPLRVTMNGGPTNLALVGTINADRGHYEFMGRRFTLTRGAVTFVGEPEFNPFIQVVAEHEVRLPGREGFEIRVVLSGNLLDLSIALESSAQPPISQTDLMSYLAFGREASSLLQLQGSALSGQEGAGGGLVGNVAALATQQLAAVALDQVVRDLERDAARNIGLDVVRITPADLPPEVFTGSYLDVLRGTEVEAGRYISPRLFVAGQARPTFVQPGARVEYRTPRGFIWTFSWQPRFLPGEPTLEQREPISGSILGSFLFREWRF